MINHLKPTHYRTNSGKLVLAIQVVILAMIGLIITASAAVSVKKAIISIGSVRLTPSIATIQHPTGGVLNKIFIRDGQTVVKNQPLFKLDTSRQSAQLDTLNKNIAASKAAIYRMKLQIENVDQFSMGSLQLPDSVPIKDQYKILETERLIFNSWLNARLERENVFLTQISAIESRMNDASSQLKITKQQHKILNQQIQKRRPAVQKGIIARTVLEGLEQRLLDQESRALQIQSAINNDQSEIIAISKNSNAQIAQENAVLSETQRAEIQRLDMMMSQKKEIENEIRLAMPLAPISGVVMGLVEKQRKTAIAGSEVIARIVPEDARPFIQVKVAANEVDNISKLKSVRVTFGFDEPVKMQHLKARVSRIDPDVQTDPETGQQNYLVDISFDPDQVRQDIIPGMPVEVGFVFDQGTLIWSLFEPFTDAYRKTFDVSELEG